MNSCFFWQFCLSKLRVFSCPQSSSSRASMESNANAKSPRSSWSDVPSELLSSIADTLGLVDLLSFRGVCKDWRLAAAMSATAKIESLPDAKPYFLLHTIDGNCMLWDVKDDKTYSINIPELKEATFLASKQGWLLLSQNGSLFFFCPFSRARIDLPEFPHSEMSDHHLGAFSHPPTSPNCIVSILNPNNKPEMELNVLSRAAGDTWTKYVHTLTGGTDSITSAIYCDGTICFEDDSSKGFSFSVGEKKWESYRIVHGEENVEKLPYNFTKCYSKRKELRKSLKVEDDVSVLAYGAILTKAKEDHAICNELIPGSNGSEGTTLKGVWIQPRFYARSSDQTWFI